MDKINNELTLNQNIQINQLLKLLAESKDNNDDKSEEKFVQKLSSWMSSSSQIAKTLKNKVLLGLINKASFGNFQQGIIDIFNKKYLSTIDDDKREKIMNELSSKGSVKNAKQKEANEKSENKDDNENLTIKEDSLRYWCFMGEQKSRKTINDLLKKINKTKKDVKKELKESKTININKLSSLNKILLMKCDDLETRKQLQNVQQQMLNEDADFDKIYQANVRILLKSLYKMTHCHSLSHTRQEIAKEKYELLSKAFDTKYGEGASDSIIAKADNAGLFDDDNLSKEELIGFSKDIEGYISPTSLDVTEVTEVVGDATSDMGIDDSVWSNILNGVASVADVVSSIGIGLAWRYRKNIKNLIGGAIKNFNAKTGVIAQIDFETEIDEDDKQYKKIAKNGRKYSLRYNIKDNKWKCINKVDINKEVSEDLIKTILEIEECKRFRKQLEKIWNPIFKSNGNIDAPFIGLLNMGEKESGISGQEAKIMQKIGDDYDTILKNCISDNYKYDLRVGK